MFAHAETLFSEVILIVERGILRKGMVHRNRGPLVGSLEVFVGACEYVASLIPKELLLSVGVKGGMNEVVLGECILLH